MQKRMIYLICIQTLILGFTLVAQAGMESENYRIPTSAISGGGAPMVSDSYKTNFTQGQSSPLMEGDQNPFSDSYDMYPGFWYTVEMEEEGEPLPDIKANGSDGPLEIDPDETLSVTIELNPGIYAGYPVDWWVVADTPFGWYYYDSGTEDWLPGFKVSYQGPLFELTPPFEVLNTSDLPVGGYTFYFGVDGNRNGNLDEPLYYDSVEVTITP